MKNQILVFDRSLTGFLIFLFVSSHIFSQANGAPSADEHSNPKVQGKPLKYEDGDVTIDLRKESDRLKRVVERRLVLVQPLFRNREKTEATKKINDLYTVANRLHLQTNFKESRRLFREALQELDSEMESILSEYQKAFDELSSKFNLRLMALKADAKLIQNQNLIPFLEQKVQESSEQYRRASQNMEGSSYEESLKHFQISINYLLIGIQKANREIFSNNSLEHLRSDGITEPILEEDYLVPGDRKLWDDVRGKIHSTEENLRKSERERILRIRQQKLKASESSPGSKSNPTQDPGDTNPKESIQQGITEKK